MHRPTVDITPGVSVLAVLRHLNYKPWYALAEFVDNSIQSFLTRRNALDDVHQGNAPLRVEIDMDSTDPPRIVIRDNAAGIAESDYGRAFRPAAVPPDRSGLAEFGMGMKSAACWFAPNWTVQTSALGEPVARTVRFDIANIVNDQIEELLIEEQAEREDQHYTTIILEDVYHMPAGRTKGKLKDHLIDIYREFIRDGTLQLFYGGDQLKYTEPKILKAPYFKTPDEPAVEWRKEISFDFGNGLSVNGFAAILETGSGKRAGFSLFRRGRVIQGSGDDGYRPYSIFGAPTRFSYQRLFGELHLNGFDVSHTKDGFRWDENEEPFLELLREHLDSGSLQMLRQCEGHRAQIPDRKLRTMAKQAVKNTSTLMEQRLPQLVPTVAAEPPVGTPAEDQSHVTPIADRTFTISFRETDWQIKVQLDNDAATREWLFVSDSDAGSVPSQPRRLSIRVSLAHPFMLRFVKSDSDDVEALLRVAAALAVAEVLARDSGVRLVGTVRRNVNDILREAFAAP